jgi:two-component system, LytTR family, sensor kinase
MVLILMTFVENVFKYGISAHEFLPIVIKIMADEDVITLFCSNRVFNAKPGMERTVGSKITC